MWAASRSVTETVPDICTTTWPQLPFSVLPTTLSVLRTVPSLLSLVSQSGFGEESLVGVRLCYDLGLKAVS